MSRLLCALALLPALSVPVRADRLVLVPARGEKTALVIPSDFLKRQEIEPVKQFGGGWSDPSLQTLMAGGALAMAAILAGLLLVRRNSARLVTGSAACVLGLLLFFNSSCSPRPAPDEQWFRDRQGVSGPTYREIHGPNCAEDGTLQGEVLLEEGVSGDPIRLVINEETLKTFAERNVAKGQN